MNWWCSFELWCWRKLLRVTWTARSNKCILKEISPEYSLEGLMLKLKLQYFGHLMGRANSLEKTLMLGKTERQEEKGTTEDEMVGWHHWLNGHEFDKLQVILKDREACHAAVHGVTKSQTWLSDWTTGGNTKLKAPMSKGMEVKVCSWRVFTIRNLESVTKSNLGLLTNPQ